MDMGQPTPGSAPGSMAGAPAGMAQGQPADQFAQGYELCIYVTPAGIKVSKEPIQQQEEGGEPPGTPAKDIMDALKQVAALYAQSSQGARSQTLRDAYANPSQAMRPGQPPTQPGAM